MLSSSAGPGCDARFFDQLDPTGTRFESGREQNLLMALQQAEPSNRYPIHCGNNPRFFAYQGKVYFEDKPSSWPPIDVYQQYHRVARINKGKVEDVCDFSFVTKVSVEKKKAADKN